MKEKTEIRLVELVAARMSHDLVGPVGATVNGIELLTEDQAADVDVVRLIGQSARQASRRLQVFRAIYGTAGALPAGAPFAAAAQLLAGMLEGEKVKAGPWAFEPEIESAGGRAGARIALLAAFIAVEALPRGGVVALEAKLTGNTVRLAATARGQGARLFEEVSATIAGKVPLEELTAKAAPAEMLRVLAGAVGGRADVAGERDLVEISVNFHVLGED